MGNWRRQPVTPGFGDVGIHVKPGPVVGIEFHLLPRPLPPTETAGDLPNGYSASRRLMSPLDVRTERFKLTPESSWPL
jgi:hypothetical protein